MAVEKLHVTLAAFALCLVSAASAEAQSDDPYASLNAVRVTLEADRDTISVTERVRLTLTVEAPPQVLITFPEMPETLGPFTVLGRKHGQSLTADQDGAARARSYLLEPKRAGQLTVPPLVLTAQDPTTVISTTCYYFLECDERTSPGFSARPRQITTEPLTITVTSVVPEGADLFAPRDIAPPVAVAAPPASPWWWQGPALALLLPPLAGLAWWLAARRPRRAGAAPRCPAHAVALAALRNLALDPAKVDEFYVRLSDILRRYADWRFAVPAPVQTTEESVASMRATNGRGKPLGALLRAADMVKFARDRPGPDAMRSALAGATSFVEQTADETVTVAVAAEPTP